MNLLDRLSRRLLAPPAKGRKALLYAILLVTIPTGFRLLVDPFVGGRLPFFTYMPFAILAGALLNWRAAALVSFAAWVTADLLFMTPRFEFNLGAAELIGFVVVAISATLIIALVEAVRTIVENSLRPAKPEGFAAPVVFSLEQGDAWASWYGSHSWVRLGPDEEVAEMMRDFLAQRELARRMESGSPAILR